MAGSDDIKFLIKYVNDRFGIPLEIFNDFLLFTKKTTFWLIKKSPLLSEVSHLKIKRLGIKAFQEVGSFVKPNTRFIQCFGHLATKAVISIDEKQLRKILDGEYLTLDEKIENGYVILSLNGQILGLGLLIDGKVRSQLPKNDVKFMITDF